MEKKDILNYLAEDYQRTMDFLQRRLPNESELKLLAFWFVKHLAILYEAQGFELDDEQN